MLQICDCVFLIGHGAGAPKAKQVKRDPLAVSGRLDSTDAGDFVVLAVPDTEGYSHAVFSLGALHWCIPLTSKQVSALASFFSFECVCRPPCSL